MSQSIVRQLTLKDLTIMRVPALSWWLGGVVSVAIVVFGGTGAWMAGMILFLTAMAGAGVHCAMQTVVEERREQTLAFVMSLPITVREYTSAKLIANLAMFTVIWATLSTASFVIFLGDNGMPLGTLPFVLIVLVGIYLAFIIILATCLVTESLGYAIASTVVANLGTQIFLWWAASLHGIRSVVGGEIPVWNGTVLAILGIQAAAIVGLIALTYLLQSRKKDFV